MSPSVPASQREVILARLVETGGFILPDALYTVAEVARFIAADRRTVRRMLEDDTSPLRAGLHDRGGQRGKLVLGSSVLAYQASIRVAG